MKNDKIVIQKTAAAMKRRMNGESTGHDWWHAYRVWQTAKRITATEPTANQLVVELAALLHDIADYKFSKGDHELGPKLAGEWLQDQNVAPAVIESVQVIIRTIDFKGANVAHNLASIEAKIVFDADKLDALGAIGIARAFAYGGAKSRDIHNPDVKPVMHDSFGAYKKNTSPTINHFYEKLLLLKDLMQTKEGRRLAQKRHAYMKRYLEEFLKEWEGER